ncbi:MAG: Fic family protein [Burkholderiales bacterium]|nr:Fic family protein [Bacteroidia bacterium]
MGNLGNTLKMNREKKKLTGTDASKLLKIDASLLNRFEKGNRLPTKEQLTNISKVYKLSLKELQIEWLSEKIYNELDGEDFALEALQVAENRISYGKSNYKDEKIIKQIDKLKKKLDALWPLPKEQLKNLEEYFRIQYTYDSNRIEGNTLTLQETALVVDKGITISGKSVHEHLEAINHSEAVELITDLVQNKTDLTEYILKQLHGLILRGINKTNAGKYRSVNVMISGSTHRPPEPFMLNNLMEEYFMFYEAHKKTMHPVLLSAEMHERLVTIHPFIDGNGRTSRLIMNLILMQHGFPITNISGDKQNRLSYYTSLEKAQVDNDKNKFYDFVSDAVFYSLKEFLKIVA